MSETKQQSQQNAKTATAMVPYQPNHAITSIKYAKRLLGSALGKIQETIPKGSNMTARAMVQAAMLAIAKNKKLLQCTQESVMESVFKAARLGLDCSGVLNSAWLVPFKNTCQLIIGYGGLADLVRRAAKTRKLEAQVVYSQDKFELNLGTQGGILHQPDLQGERCAEDVVGAYAYAVLSDGDIQIEYMTRQEIDRIRARSRAKDDGPWVTDYAEMARKCPLRRITKYLPISWADAGQLLREAITHDDQTTGIDDQLLPAGDMPSNGEGVKTPFGFSEPTPPPAEESDEPPPADDGPFRDPPEDFGEEPWKDPEQ